MARLLVLRIRPDFAYSKRRATAGTFTTLPRYRSVAFAFIFWVITVVVLLHVHQPWVQPGFSDGAERMPFVVRRPPLGERVSCYGARGVLLSNSPDDDLQYGDVQAGEYFSILQCYLPLKDQLN